MEACRARVPRDNPVYASTEGRLAYNYTLLGRYAEAAPLFADALEIERANPGVDRADTIVTLNSYSLFWFDQGSFDKAADLAKEACDLAVQQYGRENRETLASMNNLALAYDRSGRNDEAAVLWEESLESKRRVFGPESAETAMALNNFGYSCSRKGNLEKAREYYGQAYDIRLKVLGNHPDTAISAYNVASILIQMGKKEEARPYLAAALKIQEQCLGPADADTQDTRKLLESLDPRQGKRAPH